MAYSVGDRVRAAYKRVGGKWYPGKIALVCEEGYNIDYDDGDKELFVSIERIMPESGNDYAVGDRVEGNYKSIGKYFPGVIRASLPGNAYHINYDDGDKEENVPADRLRTANEPQAHGKYNVGDRVDSSYKSENGNWFPGVIAKINADGTYNVNYDDGDREVNVGEHRLRLPLTTADLPRILEKIKANENAAWKDLGTLANGASNHAEMIEQGLMKVLTEASGLFNGYQKKKMLILHFLTRHGPNCAAIVQSGLGKRLVDELLRQLEGKTYFQEEANTVGLLCTIVNMSQFAPAFKLLRSSNVIPMIKLALQSSDVVHRMYGALVLLFLGGRDEKGEWFDLVSSSLTVVGDILECIGGTMIKKGGRFGYGKFDISSLCLAIRIMAIADANKSILIEKKTIDTLVTVLRAFVDEVPAAGCCGGGALDVAAASSAVEALLELSFAAESYEDIETTFPLGEGLIGMVEKFLATQQPVSDDTKRCASSLLRRLKNEAEPVAAEVPEGAKKHVMISYAWAVKPQAIALAEAITAAGHEVWRDEVGSSLVPKMSGSTDEIMALAVENSSTIVIVVSEEYKNSANCRMEAAYANQLKKKGKLEIIYVMSQPHYTTVSEPASVDGWLGIMVGASLWYACFEPEAAAEAVSQFSNKIASGSAGGAVVSASATATPFVKPNALASMDRAGLNKWLEKGELQSLALTLEQFHVTGRSLKALQHLYKKDPLGTVQYISNSFDLPAGQALHLASLL